MNKFVVENSYRDRRVEFRGIRKANGYNLKLYSILREPGDLNWEQFEAGMNRACEILPQPAVDTHRPGVGIVIAHQAGDLQYLVICWWDRENELPIRVFVRETDSADPFEPANLHQSVCVWDLQVIWAERHAYVGTVLSQTGPTDLSAYLAASAFSGVAQSS